MLISSGVGYFLCDDDARFTSVPNDGDDNKSYQRGGDSASHSTVRQNGAASINA